ncbi:MAG: hypothetical protein JWL71_3857 [Acidobacteria bacterium]|nr:hypothetical protein [Acidobacteriota bacterium]
MKGQSAAIEAVAREFSATWEQGGDPPDAYLVVAGKRVPVVIARLKQRRGARVGIAARPRLRFDKVATRLMDRLQAALGDTARDGRTVLLTITAPIRLPAKTAASLEAEIRTLLGSGSPRRAATHTIHGNRVEIRLVRNPSARAPTMIGFVHNSDSDAHLLFDMTREWLALISAEAGRQGAARVGDRWLVVRSADGSACLEVYRYIASQLRTAADFEKIVMVFGDGRVGTVAGMA